MPRISTKINAPKFIWLRLLHFEAWLEFKISFSSYSSLLSGEPKYIETSLLQVLVSRLRSSTSNRLNEFFSFRQTRVICSRAHRPRPLQSTTKWAPNYRGFIHVQKKTQELFFSRNLTIFKNKRWMWTINCKLFGPNLIHFPHSLALDQAHKNYNNLDFLWKWSPEHNNVFIVKINLRGFIIS